MGGILLIAVNETGEEIIFGGHASDIAKFMNMEDISDELRDRHDGTITISIADMSVIVNSDYFKMSKTGIAFWKALGFRVLTEAGG